MRNEDDWGVIEDARASDLERRAIDAWLEEEPAELAAPDFVDRVMAAEEAAGPVLFAVEDVEAPPQPRRWPRIALRVVAGVAAASGLIAVAAVPWDIGDPVHVAGVGGPGNFVQGIPEPPGPISLPDGTPGTPFPDDLDEKIEAYVADYGRNWGPAFKFHGTIVVARDGEVKYARGFGVADPSTGIANEPDTRFRLGLLTEQFTAAAILRLRDEGALRLSDPISKYLPELTDGNQITIEQLLDHTSGIPNYTDHTYFMTWKGKPHSTEEMLGRISAVPLEFEPGTDFNPTNSGYYLLGAIIERVTGMPYGDYMDRDVFRPAGMHKTTFGDAYETGEQARGNVWNDEEVLDPPDPISMSVFGGAGGLVSAATDLAKWDKALYDGAILSEASVDEMTSPSEHGYGFGYVVDKGYGQTVLSFPAAIDGFNGGMLRFTEDRTLVVVLCNTEVVPGQLIARDVAMFVYGDAPPRRHEYDEVQIAPGTYSKYLGAYHLNAATRERYAAVLDQERLELLATVNVRRIADRMYFDVPKHGLTWMHPMGGGEFFFKDHAGETVSFEMDEKGQAVAMTVHYQDAQFVLERQTQ